MQSPSSPHPTDTIDSYDFYAEYHGHKVRHLQRLLPFLRHDSSGETCNLIWTAGDSSLDNKYWFRHRSRAVGGYAQVLRPPTSKSDVTYWLNYLSSQRQSSDEDATRKNWVAVNTAVEATTLNQRVFGLLPQDQFCCDNMQQNDVLVVSIGGNDVALAPTPCTIASMAGLLCCVSQRALQRGFTCCTLPCDDFCCGCGPSLLSCAGGYPPCLGYLRHMFGTRVEHYLRKLTSKTRPKFILVCMIYYPDENPRAPSWASMALGAMSYNTHPERVQRIIQKVFFDVISKIHVPGTTVVPVPLFQVLDGKHTDDYIARVEPSPSGGRKMAQYLLDIIDSPDAHMSNLSRMQMSWNGNNSRFGSKPSPAASVITERCKQKAEQR